MGSTASGSDNTLGPELNPPPSAFERRASSSRRRADHYQGGRLTPISMDYILQRKANGVQLDPAEIMRTALDFDRYTFNSRVLRNLPEYDNCREYCKVANQNEMLEKEIKKISDFATSDRPPLFDSHACFGGVGRHDFEAVSGVADQLLCNLQILVHDNARLGLQVWSTASDCWESLMDSRHRLKTRYAREDASMVGYVEGRQPLCLPNPEENLTAYYHLLDFILGVVAWWSMRCAESKYWKRHIIAVLAKWAVKLKVVAQDPVERAADTLAETENTFKQMQAEADWRDAALRVGGKQRDIAILEDNTDVSNIYFEEKMIVRSHLMSIMVTILDTLLLPDKWGTDAESFGISAFIYRTGLEGITSMLVGHRHGHVIATSNLQHINFSYDAFSLLEHYTEKLKNNKTTAADAVIINCLVRGGKAPKSNFSLDKIDDVVSLMVPLSLMNPSVSRTMEELISFTYMVADANDAIRKFEPPPRHFALEYTMVTKAWSKKQDEANNRYTAPLSRSPLRRGILGLTPQHHLGDMPTRTEDLPLADKSVSPRIAELYEEYQKELPKMSPDRWKIAASTITVTCTLHVAVIQTIAALIVFGGLAVPFTVRDRIPGVDPFQIAMLTWLIAGAVLVAAKSRYTNSWSWHDFFHRRVTCHRLSDLCDVSGIDPQVVLLHLLHNEWSLLLVTQGPYNGMFRKKCDPRGKLDDRSKRFGDLSNELDAGFSIDEGVASNTMFASGFVLLVVLNAQGEHLICIDGRKGAWDAARLNRRANWLTCPDFNHDALESAHGSGIADSAIERKIHLLRRKDFRWAKVVGVYVKKSYFG